MMDSDERCYAAILAYLDGTMGPEERAELERRIESEPSMKELVQFAASIRQEREKIDYGELRDSIHRLAERQLTEIKRADVADHEAVTIYDSRFLPLPDGVRPATIDSRRMRFRAGEYELSLSAYPVSVSTYELIGQLTAGDCGDELIAEVVAARKRLTAQANRFHVFRFPRIEIGSCRLTVKSPHGVLVVVNIEL